MIHNVTKVILSLQFLMLKVLNHLHHLLLSTLLVNSTMLLFYLHCIKLNLDNGFQLNLKMYNLLMQLQQLFGIKHNPTSLFSLCNNQQLLTTGFTLFKSVTWLNVLSQVYAIQTLLMTGLQVRALLQTMFVQCFLVGKDLKTTISILIPLQICQILLQ